MLAAELAGMVGILMGSERAASLTSGLVEYLEMGMPESWYEKKLRRRYGETPVTPCNTPRPT